MDEQKASQWDYKMENNSETQKGRKTDLKMGLKKGLMTERYLDYQMVL